MNQRVDSWTAWVRVRRWSGLGLVMVMVMGLAALTASAQDDPPGRVGRVGEVRGPVWMQNGGQGESFGVQRNQPVTTGDHLSTDRDGRVEVQIGSTTLRLAGRSDLQVLALDDRRIEVLLNRGSVALRVREPEAAAEIGVQTADGRFSPARPGLFRIDRGEQSSFAAAQGSDLQFDARDSSLTIRTGQRAEVWQDPADGRTHYSWAQPSNDDFDRWARSDAGRGLPVAEQQHWVSPEMTGVGDLDAYGQWQTSAEYGPLWAPMVDVGWAPYRYGHWAWVSPWGWTWVDDAPWGFAPFHYGRWVLWGGRWCWAPGRYEPRPVYAPALVAWVGGGQFGLSMAVGAGAAVGWIALAPDEPYHPTYRVSDRYWDRLNRPDERDHDGRDWHRDRDARPPTMYRNQAVAGGVTAVAGEAWNQRRAVPVGRQRAPDAAVMGELRAGRAQFVAPAAPNLPRGAGRPMPVPPGVMPAQQRPQPAPFQQPAAPAAVPNRGPGPSWPADARPGERGRELPGRNEGARMPAPAPQVAPPFVPARPAPQQAPVRTWPAPAPQAPAGERGPQRWAPEAPSPAPLPDSVRPNPGPNRSVVPVAPPAAMPSAGRAAPEGRAPALVERPAPQRPAGNPPADDGRRDNPRDGRPERRIDVN